MVQGERLRAVLITAATPWEARPLAKALGLPPDGPGLWRGLVGSRRAVLLETGVGADAARSSLDRVFGSANGSTPGLMVSAGLCGALQEGLRCGDVVVDVRGAPVGLARAAAPAAERARVRLHMGAVAHADKVLAPAQKRALGGKQRAAAVDMESAAVREWAESRNAAFVAARCVLDALDETAPAEGPEGESLRELVRFLAVNWTRLPGLVRTGLRCRRAMDALGRFLAEYLPDANEDPADP